MRKVKKITRRTPKPSLRRAVKAFVVYCTYPNSCKEYAYLCDAPDVRQGDLMVGNGGTHMVVRRTAEYDPMACRWTSPASDNRERRRNERAAEIRTRMNQISKEIAQDDFFGGLAKRSPEAKKLLAELKRL